MKISKLTLFSFLSITLVYSTFGDGRTNGFLSFQDPHYFAEETDKNFGQINVVILRSNGSEGRLNGLCQVRFVHVTEFELRVHIYCYAFYVIYCVDSQIFPLFFFTVFTILLNSLKLII